MKTAPVNVQQRPLKTPIAVGLLFAAVLLNVAAAMGAEPPKAVSAKDAPASVDSSKDPAALQRLRALARQGDAKSQFELGAMYDTGKGVPQDFAEAIKWYRKAADQGDALAQLLLGEMYTHGQGAPQDFMAAHVWCNLAAARFSASAKKLRDDAVECRSRIASKLTPAQIAEAQRLARDWKPRSK